MNIHMLETYNKRKDEIWRLDRLILSRHRTPILKNNKINLPEEVMGGGMLEEIFKISLYLPCPVHSTKFLIIAHKLHEPLSFLMIHPAYLMMKSLKKLKFSIRQIGLMLGLSHWLEILFLQQPACATHPYILKKASMTGLPPIRLVCRIQEMP